MRSYKMLFKMEITNDNLIVRSGDFSEVHVV